MVGQRGECIHMKIGSNPAGQKLEETYPKI